MEKQPLIQIKIPAVNWQKLAAFFNPYRIFILVILILTMYNNLEHSASVYLSIAANPNHSADYNSFQSYMVVIVIDLAVIAFIISSKKRESEVFAWVIFLVNLLYFNILQSFYYIGDYIYYAWIGTPEQSKLLFAENLILEIKNLIAKLAFSGLFSYCIHRFSYLWFEKKQQESMVEDIKRKEQIILDLKTAYEKLLQEVERSKERERILLEELPALYGKINSLSIKHDEVVEENERIKSRLTRRRSERFSEVQQ